MNPTMSTEQPSGDLGTHDIPIVSPEKNPTGEQAGDR